MVLYCNYDFNFASWISYLTRRPMVLGRLPDCKGQGHIKVKDGLGYTPNQVWYFEVMVSNKRQGIFRGWGMEGGQVDRCRHTICSLSSDMAIFMKLFHICLCKTEWPLAWYKFWPRVRISIITVEVDQTMQCTKYLNWKP